MVDLGGPAAVVAPSLQPRSCLGDFCEAAGNAAVDLEAGAATHARRRYSKQFSMVNVNMRVRPSPWNDRKSA